MDNLTKEETIDLYLKILKSDNREFVDMNPYRMILYRKKTPITTASFVAFRDTIKGVISVDHNLFLLEKEESDAIEKQTHDFFHSHTKQDLLDSL